MALRLVGVQRAVGLVGHAVGAEIDAAVEPQRPLHAQDRVAALGERLAFGIGEVVEHILSRQTPTKKPPTGRAGAFSKHSDLLARINVAASRSAQIPRRRSIRTRARAGGKHSCELVCLYARLSGRSIAAAHRKNRPMDAPTLDSLRQEIDAIDSDLHGLIRRRADGGRARSPATKPAGGLALRPGREAQVMRQRLATHDGQLPRPPPSIRMWREMMSAFTLMQTPGLKIAICRPADQPGYWDLARDHFGCQIPLRRPRHAGAGAGRGARQPDDHRRRAGADRGRYRAVVAAACRRRRRPCPTSWPACPSSPCPTRARAASRPSCWPASSPRRAATDRALISVEAQERHQPQPHRRRPGQGGLPGLHLGAGPGRRPACITISSSCRA